MKMNDCLFERTSLYFNTLLFIEVFGFFLPLVLQILYEGNENFVLKCNYSCLAVIILLHIQEILLWRNLSSYEYWYKNIFSIVINIIFVIYYYYFYLRIKKPKAFILPLSRYDSDSNKCIESDTKDTIST